MTIGYLAEPRSLDSYMECLKPTDRDKLYSVLEHVSETLAGLAGDFPGRRPSRGINLKTGKITWYLFGRGYEDELASFQPEHWHN